MRRLVYRIIRRGRQGAGEQENGQLWREVPRLNLLHWHGVTGGRRQLAIRVALGLIIAVEVAYVLVQIRQTSANEGAVELANAKQKEVQAAVTSEQAVVDELKNRVDAARKRVEDNQKAYEALATGRPDWNRAVVTLLSTETEGVRLTSIVGEPSGGISIDGIASSLGAMSRFQAQLRSASRAVSLESISFESLSSSSSETLKFTAALRVVR